MEKDIFVKLDTCRFVVRIASWRNGQNSRIKILAEIFSCEEKQGIAKLMQRKRLSLELGPEFK